MCLLASKGVANVLCKYIKFWHVLLSTSENHVWWLRKKTLSFLQGLKNDAFLSSHHYLGAKIFSSVKEAEIFFSHKKEVDKQMFPLHISYFENVLMQIFQILCLVWGTLYSKPWNILKLDHTHIKVIYFHFILWIHSESIFGNSAFHIKINSTQLLPDIIKYKVL